MEIASWRFCVSAVLVLRCPRLQAGLCESQCDALYQKPHLRIYTQVQAIVESFGQISHHCSTLLSLAGLPGLGYLAQLVHSLSSSTLSEPPGFRGLLPAVHPMLRKAGQGLQQSSKCCNSSGDLLGQTLAALRSLAEGQSATCWRSTFSRGFAKLPGSEPLPGAPRHKRPGSRRNLPQEPASPFGSSNTDISPEDHDSNIASLRQSSAATGADPPLYWVAAAPVVGCLECVVSVSVFFAHLGHK